MEGPAGTGSSTQDEREQDTSMEVGDNSSTIVPHPRGAAVIGRFAVGVAPFAGAAVLIYLTGRSLLHFTASLLIALFAVLLFVLSVARTVDRRPQAVLRLNGIELRKYWYSALEFREWGTIRAVSDIRTPTGFSYRGEGLGPGRWQDRWASFLMMHFFVITTGRGETFRLYDPGPSFELSTVRKMVLERATQT